MEKYERKIIKKYGVDALTGLGDDPRILKFYYITGGFWGKKKEVQPVLYEDMFITDECYEVLIGNNESQIRQWFDGGAETLLKINRGNNDLFLFKVNGKIDFYCDDCADGNGVKGFQFSGQIDINKNGIQKINNIDASTYFTAMGWEYKFEGGKHYIKDKIADVSGTEIFFNRS